jgi:hypothetical protein
VTGEEAVEVAEPARCASVTGSGACFATGEEGPGDGESETRKRGGISGGGAGGRCSACAWDGRRKEFWDAMFG